MDELKKQSKLSSYFTEVRRVESTRDMDFSHTDPFLEEKATQQFGLPKVEESPAKVRSKTSSHQNSKNNAMTFMQKLTLCHLDAMWTRRQVFAWAFKKHGCGESTIRNVLDSGEKFFHKLVIEGHADQYRIRPSTAYGVALASVDLELRALSADWKPIITRPMALVAPPRPVLGSVSGSQSTAPAKAKKKDTAIPVEDSSDEVDSAAQSDEDDDDEDDDDEDDDDED